MAGALLGLKKLRAFMEAHLLTLEQAEQALRWEANECVEIWHSDIPGTPKEKWGARTLPWTKADLGDFAPYGILYSDEENAFPLDDEVLTQEAHRREAAKLKKRRSEGGANFRHLWSWLLDELDSRKSGVLRGEKLRVVLGSCANPATRTKRSCQLDEDGHIILEALGMLSRDPGKVRRTANRSRSPAVQLAFLSLKMRDEQDLRKVRLEENLRAKLTTAQVNLARAKAEVRRLEEELGHLISVRPPKTGKKKRR